MDVAAVSRRIPSFPFVVAQGPGVQAVLHGGLQPGGRNSLPENVRFVCKGVLEKVRDFWD